MKKILMLWLLFLLKYDSLAGPLNLSNVPLFLSKSPSPLTLIVMGRDHKLYYEAYNDASDLNQDGILDIRFNPNIDYFGYFDSYKCYSYSQTNNKFIPSSVTTNKKCTNLWSGNFLNYLTTSRMDALRKVLYGGYRSTDSTTTTTLERSYIPQDAHSWGKEYTSIAIDGYDIRDYTPLLLPLPLTRHLFSNTTLLNGNNLPLLRVAKSLPYRSWEWVSIERPVADNKVLHGLTGISILSSITDYVVRVDVCKTNLLEPNCREYSNGSYKPTGLLHDFGENDQMKFGLLTGSYTKNLSGGVLRKNITSFKDEVDMATGQFTSINGIVQTLNKLKVVGFDGSYIYEDNCGFIFNRDMNEGECRMWGNPIGEMMYEGLRYFAGKSSPTPAFDYSSGDDTVLGLPKATWQNPYNSSNNPWCAQPNMLIISDITPSYDSDQIPGSNFSSFTGDIGMNAKNEGTSIWQNEFGNSSKTHYIGQSGTNQDGTPSAKTVTSFGNIRGLAPEEPNKQGSYYSASVAYYARKTDINSVKGDQRIHSFVVALASPIPQINIPVNNKIITIIPFAKSVGPKPPNCSGGIDSTKGAFQPTNQIVDFYVENITDSTGTFQINFEDAQQGADHDMDAIVKYSYQVNANNTVTINLQSTYAAGCIIQHMGYIISGTTKDGIYLEVRDADTSSSGDINYFLDTPPGQSPGGNWQTGSALPLNASRTFSIGQSDAATLLNNPLLYVAKYGGFNDLNNNNIPDDPDEFDADNNQIPDNYFSVTNALNLKNQLSKAFDNIIKRDNSSSSVALSSQTLNSNLLIFQAKFNSIDWSGKLLAYSIDPTSGLINYNGAGPEGSLWEAGLLLSTLDPMTSRQLITMKRTSKKGIAFRWPQNANSPTTNELSSGQITDLNGSSNQGKITLEYIRGVRSKEKQNGGTFRNRTTLLGDIINSKPVYHKATNFPYPDEWPSGAAENNVLYSTFYATTLTRKPVLYVGANDGMMHAFDPSNGKELFAYVPDHLLPDLDQLTQANYIHDYYVDGPITIGDAFINNQWETVLLGNLGGGGQGLFALKITNPTSFSESNASNIVLWEFTDKNDNGMGYTIGKSLIVRLNNGKWGAIVSNGYNNTENDANKSSTGQASLYIIDLADGSLIKKLTAPPQASDDPLQLSRPNGFAEPAVVDTNNDYIADIVYVGDLFGNLWKIDLSSTNATNWKFAFNNNPLYVAKDKNGVIQPITSAPMVKIAPNLVNAYQIFFGTGKFLENDDKTNMQVQTFYALIDSNNTISNRSQLLEQKIIQEVNHTAQNGQSIMYRLSSNYTLNSNHKGWYMDLIFNTVTGERIINQPMVRNKTVIFTTVIPSNDQCEYGGSGWLMELDTYSGSRLAVSPYDTNNDGTFTEADNLTYSGNNKIPATGVRSEVGILTSPTIAKDENKEYKFLSGSSGSIQTVIENPQVKSGRESWLQLQ